MKIPRHTSQNLDAIEHYHWRNSDTWRKTLFKFCFTLFILLLGAVLTSMPHSQSRKPVYPITSCAKPAFERPTYTQRADDSVALSTLLEASGYAAAFNSNWVDLAAGNFCGGPEKELLLLKNKHSNFSILRGPSPYAVGAGDLNSHLSHPWRAVTTADLNGDGFDEIVALRKIVTTNVHDLVVARVNSSTCEVSTMVASIRIGNPANSNWIDAAVGDFDGSGNRQIVLLKEAHSNFFFVKFVPPNTLTIVGSSDLETHPSHPWKAVVAGDLDGDGKDELIATRQVSNNVGATVLAYKWSGSVFNRFAMSTIGNNGNSRWTSAATGDFNADGRDAVVLLKNQHSNFFVVDYPPGSTNQLRVLASDDLDSASSQPWKGLIATDWLPNDHGASELVAVRAANGKHRADLFVYGNPFHRVASNSALERTKAEFDHDMNAPVEDLKNRFSDTHTNTLNWLLYAAGHYDKLVEFLQATKDFCVDGRQFRVWVTLVPPAGVCTRTGNPENSACKNGGDFFGSLPEESDSTSWSEAPFFKAGLGIASVKDYVGWASVMGRLAQEYPHLVAIGIDDFSHFPTRFSGDYIAEMESKMRSRSPWMSFAPTVYFRDFKNDRLPDLASTLDALLFYFRNEKQGLCLAGACGEASINNAPGEFSFMSKFIPRGRKLQVGVYFGTLFSVSPPEEPTVLYDFNLVRLILNDSSLGGVTGYPARPSIETCGPRSYLTSKYCGLKKNFSEIP